MKRKTEAILSLMAACLITAGASAESGLPSGQPESIIEENESYHKTENTPLDSRIAAAAESFSPGCQIFDYAQIGNEGTEYIVLVRDAADRAAVMIADTENGAEFCNFSIMVGIPLDKDQVRIMDHLADGHPYLWYTDPEGTEFLYVVFRKSEEGGWMVNEAQFGDDWQAFYSFQYKDEDQKIHLFLTGNDLTALPDGLIDRNASSFDPAAARQTLREILDPYLH